MHAQMPACTVQVGGFRWVKSLAQAVTKLRAVSHEETDMARAELVVITGDLCTYSSKSKCAYLNICHLINLKVCSLLLCVHPWYTSISSIFLYVCTAFCICRFIH